MTAVAEITGLRVETGGRAIVDGVDLRVLPGRVTALVGASGSGKTTTGLALLGEFPAGALVRGDVRVPEGLVGYVPQHPGAVLNPARRVGALLGDIARLRPACGDATGSVPMTYSGGSSSTRIAPMCAS
ncbi:ATP-binding cassette domain-containing protein, partial [Streptomyces zhihengii]